MIERLTIDAFADEIERSIKAAEPASKLARKFYRKGRRDGRKQIEPKTMESFTTRGVSVAASMLAEEYLAEVASLQAQLSSAKAVPDPGTDPSGGGPDAEPNDGDGQGAGAEGAPPEGGQAASSSTRREALDTAMDGLKRNRIEAEARAREEERRREREAKKQAEAEIVRIDHALVDCGQRYRQLVESCHELGGFLWARYCVGFSVGKAKRGNPDQDDPDPEIELDWEYPSALQVDEGADHGTP